MNGLNKQQWEEILEKIGSATNAKICLIGSAACIFSGMEGRTSIDLDVWKPKSQFDTPQLRKATEAAGLLFNPTSTYVDKPYIQIVEPGIVQVGNFNKEEDILNAGGLSVTRPPIENIIASKLVRGDAKDIEDIAHLMVSQPDLSKVKAAIESMPERQKLQAMENFVFIEVLSEPNI